MSKGEYTYGYPRPCLTVDCVVFGVQPEAEDPMQVLLVKRGDDPFKTYWALPGGHVHVGDEVGKQGESLEAAARRELQEETAVDISHLEQLYTFGAPDRDPRGRYISVGYYALVRTSDFRVKGGSDASEAQWVSVRQAMGMQLAFDHNTILGMAVQRLRGKVRYAPIGFYLLPPTFTLRQIQRLYEAVLDRKFDRGNFRKKIEAMGILAEAGFEKRSPGKPGPLGKLYRFDKRAYDRAVRKGWNFEIRSLKGR
jgi:8-oxo-dGTP diphosphatase